MSGARPDPRLEVDLCPRPETKKKTISVMEVELWQLLLPRTVILRAVLLNPDFLILDGERTPQPPRSLSSINCKNKH